MHTIAGLSNGRELAAGIAAHLEHASPPPATNAGRSGIAQVGALRAASRLLQVSCVPTEEGRGQKASIAVSSLA
jgi:hypothetical protein